MKFSKGMSLLEILVVVAIFAVLGIIITRSIVLTLQGSRKSETSVRVRENLDFTLSVIERQLRNADSVPQCPNMDTSIINYIDQSGNASSFSCVNMGSNDPYVASGSARLTSLGIKVTSCSFICEQGSSANPPSINVFLQGEDASASGSQNTNITASTQIFLRNY